MPVMTGLSGNEMYCLKQKGFEAGDLVVGNSVFSIGFVGGIGSGLRTLVGGEVTPITDIIREGRQQSYKRMVAEAQRHSGVGITGVTSELVFHAGNVEFLSIGSALHRSEGGGDVPFFSTCADGQELYSQIDSGFYPIGFVFGNVAYSIGVGGGVMGSLRSLKRGEVKEYSEILNVTRHLAIERISAEARSLGANSVVGIQTSIIPIAGMQEMLMIGTASHHGALPPEYKGKPVTSDLTNEEMWNLVHLGFCPIQLVLGVSVFSLGVVGGITSAFKGLVKGEIAELTSMIYSARANAIGKIEEDARRCGADDVVGIKTYLYDLGGGMIEFMAIGTAVKKMPGFRTTGQSLPAQVVIKDKDTFITTTQNAAGVKLNEPTNDPRNPIVIVIAILAYALLAIFSGRGH